MPRNKNKASRKAKNGLTTTRVTTVGGFSDRSRVTLRYVAEFNNSPATTQVITTLFSGNSPFNPDTTGAGTQPANFDDFSSVYRRYRCWGSKMYVNPTSELDTNEDGQRIVVVPQHTNSTATTHALQNNLIALPHSQYRESIYYNIGFNTITMPYMSTAKFWGLSTDEFQGQDDAVALVTASPAHQWYWAVSNGNINVANTSNTTFFTVIIDYDVEFWDRVDTTLDLDSKILHLISIRDHKSEKSSEKEPSETGEMVVIDPPESGVLGAYLSRVRARQEFAAMPPAMQESYARHGVGFARRALG